MRHYMMDPDNEERLLKIPLRVVAEIKAEAYIAAQEAVRGVNWFNDEGLLLSAIVATADSIAAIDALRTASND